MPNRRSGDPGNVTPAKIRATTYLEYHQNEVLDAVATAAALVALSDRRIEPVECGQLIDFLDRSEFLPIFTRREILDAFERCLQELREPGIPALAVKRLAQHAGRPFARVIINVGEEVAAADCRVDPREQRMLQLIRIILSAVPSPTDSGSGQGAVAR
jgi:tellurite resistance protein